MNRDPTMRALNDSEIIAQISLGRRELFSEIVQKYEQRIRGFCMSMLKDSALSEDAAQEVFIKAFQGLNGFRSDSSFSTWLFRIAANHCRDVLRKRARESLQSWDALLDSNHDRFEALFSEPSTALSAIEHRELVIKLLSALPDDYREIVTLREIQQLSYAEIADVLICSLDAVKSRLKRARSLLNDKLGHFLTFSSSV